MSYPYPWTPWVYNHDVDHEDNLPNPSPEVALSAWTVQTEYRSRAVEGPQYDPCGTLSTWPALSNQHEEELGFYDIRVSLLNRVTQAVVSPIRVEGPNHAEAAAGRLDRFVRSVFSGMGTYPVRFEQVYRYDFPGQAPSVWVAHLFAWASWSSSGKLVRVIIMDVGPALYLVRAEYINDTPRQPSRITPAPVDVQYKRPFVSQVDTPAQSPVPLFAFPDPAPQTLSDTGPRKASDLYSFPEYAQELGGLVRRYGVSRPNGVRAVFPSGLDPSLLNEQGFMVAQDYMFTPMMPLPSKVPTGDCQTQRAGPFPNTYGTLMDLDGNTCLDLVTRDYDKADRMTKQYQTAMYKLQ